MPTKLCLEKPIDHRETYQLAEVTDLLYRRLRNVGYSRKHAEAALPDRFTALQAAAARIIRSVPVGVHPVNYINNRNLAVLRVGTMSAKRAIVQGAEGRVYTAIRGHLFEDGRFVPTAETLKAGFALFSVRKEQWLTRLSLVRPSEEYLN